MQRASPLIVVLVMAVATGLGWLAFSFLRSGPASTDPAATVSTSAEGSTDPATPDPASVDSAAPGAVREEESRPPSIAFPTIDPESGAPGSISGRVLGPKGELVAMADVELVTGPSAGLTLRSLNSPTGLLLKTDEAGAYRFERVPPGEDYLVFASHGQFGDCAAGPVLVRSGEETRVGDIRLDVGLKIEGFVTCSGRGVADATILLSNGMDRLRRIRPVLADTPGLPPDTEPLELRTLTDEDGHYGFADVPFDTFEITADAAGLSRVTKTSQGSLFGATSRDHRVDFELEVAATLRGRVVTEAGGGVAEARVQATLANADVRCVAESDTDASGAFEIGRLAPGQYFLAVECKGFSSAHRAQVATGGDDVEIVLLRQGGVSGIVVDEETGAPVEAFELHALQNFKGRGPVPYKDKSWRFKDPGGRFEIPELDPGDYSLRGDAEGYAASESATFTIERGQTTPSVRIEMNRGGSVTGVVVDKSGSPVRSALVRVRQNRMKDNPILDIFNRLGGMEREPRARTRADGSFRIDLIVPDTYQVMITHLQLAPIELNDVEIVKGGARDLGTLEISAGARVFGSAADLDGRPLVGATVAAISTANDYRHARTDNEGLYEISGLPDGEFTLTISQAQTNPPLGQLEMLIFARNSAKKVTLADGDDVRVDLRLSREKP